MNVKRFTARSSREALMAVRQAFGDDAVVVSTRPCPEGVEVLAMAPDSLQHFERVASAPAPVPATRARGATRGRAAPPPAPEAAATSVERDVETLGMSTLSFQDYVRERVLRRRQAEMQAQAAPAAVAHGAAPAAGAHRAVPAAASAPARRVDVALGPAVAPAELGRAAAEPPAAHAAARDTRDARDARTAHGQPAPVLGDRAPHAAQDLHDAFDAPAVRMARDARDAGAPLPGRAAVETPESAEMMNELRSMRGLIEQRFGALAFMDKLQRQPRQAQLAQKLLDFGFSPQLVRKLVDGLPDGADETAWATSVLERNLATGEREAALEDRGGIYALIGSTGVGKTTSTAKLAAAFATKHGAANLGLVTLDAYRVAAHEQLRTYGRILGVPVHTAHDRASLEDLLDLLSGKKMVLIDTAGMAQRDSRTRELLEMLSHRAVQRLLVVNAAAQGETIEDVLVSYRAASCKGVVLSKIDEAVKLGPAIDAVIRHQLPVLAVANGQRVPEDWHRLSAHALVQRALRGGGNPAWRLDASDVNLVFAGLPAAVAASAARAGGAAAGAGLA
jgi:flagellar biosynthesis protein FlhF